METTNTYIPAAPIPLTLIADDQPDVATALRLLLRSAGLRTEAVSSPADVLEAIKRRDFDLVLIDLNYARDTTSGQEGLDLITNIRNLDSTLPVVVLTGWGTVELAVEAMHRGVHDFVQKPWDNPSLLKTVQTQIEIGRQRREQLHREAANLHASKRLEQELADAQEIQRALLPKELPRAAGLDVAVAWQPARTVGGDYFDLIQCDSDHTAFCIADVAGKGMPAALLMSNMQAVVKSSSTETQHPAALCDRVNAVICENIVGNRFISCFYGVLDARDRKLTYANAGHYPPMLVRDGVCSRLDQSDAVLGVFPNQHYQQHEVQLFSGDYLALFTDGVTEATNSTGEEFGEARLEAELTAGANLSPQELRDRIVSAVTGFADGHFDDDVTLMLIKVE